MATARYTFMQKRVTTLRRFMLPARFDPTGLYTDRVHQRTAAFRLLVHAEFESYLEERVTNHVTTRVDDWVTRRHPSVTLAALFAYDEIEGRSPTSLLNPPQKSTGLLEDRLNEAVKRFNRQVRVYNHGVRESNILGMLMPIGYDASNLDLVWLAEIDSWASERGDLAHQSSGKLRIKLDPAREYAKVKHLLAGFRKIDEAIARLP